MENGKIYVFEHSLEAIDNFMTPLLSEAKENAAYNPEHERAMSLMSRLTSPAIAERKGHFEFTDPTINKKVTGDEINNFRIPVHDIR